MSADVKYVVYRCDVCTRETEIPLDGRRPDPVRCNITQKCRGKLQRIGLRSNRNLLFPQVFPGLNDYVPRGTTVVPTPIAVSPNPITLFTGGDGILALSGLRRAYGPGGDPEIFWVKDVDGNDFTVEEVSPDNDYPLEATLVLKLFELTPELLAFNKYTYVSTNSVYGVSGPDDGPEGRNLRFTAVNKLDVYVNGVLLAPPSDPPVSSDPYVVSLDNQSITFTPAIFDTNNVVEVVVYSDLSTIVSSGSTVDLTFRSLLPTVDENLAVREVNCWGNYGAVRIDGVDRFTLFCEDLSQLDPQKSYGVVRAVVTSVDTFQTAEVDPDDFFLLLGREPFAFQDKEQHAYVTGRTLVDDQAILTYNRSSASGALQLTINDTSVTQVYAPITPLYRVSQLPATSTGTVLGTAQRGSEELKPKYILGPS